MLCNGYQMPGCCYLLSNITLTVKELPHTGTLLSVISVSWDIKMYFTASLMVTNTCQPVMPDRCPLRIKPCFFTVCWHGLLFTLIYSFNFSKRLEKKHHSSLLLSFQANRMFPCGNVSKYLLCDWLNSCGATDGNGWQGRWERWEWGEVSKQPSAPRFCHDYIG